MKNTGWVWPAIIILASVGVGLTALANVLPPVRPVLALLFMLICPGMAWIRLLHISDASTELTLGIALSLGIDSLVAAVMLYAGMWSPPGSLIVLIGISVAGASLQIWSGLKHVRFQAQQVAMTQDGELP